MYSAYRLDCLVHMKHFVSDILRVMYTPYVVFCVTRSIASIVSLLLPPDRGETARRKRTSPPPGPLGIPSIFCVVNAVNVWKDPDPAELEREAVCWLAFAPARLYG